MPNNTTNHAITYTNTSKISFVILVINSSYLKMLSYGCEWFHFQNTHFFESLSSFPCNKQQMRHFDNKTDIEKNKFIFFCFCLFDCLYLIKSRYLKSRY